MDTNLEKAKKTRRCPKCGSTQVAKIIYGKKPPKKKKGELTVYGGPTIPVNAPNYKCLKCNSTYKHIN
jgi:DNA-directed RNA polymerase subunit RPC12/RpoP